jgi:hypothetical protein
LKTFWNYNLSIQKTIASFCMAFFEPAILLVFQPFNRRKNHAFAHALEQANFPERACSCASDGCGFLVVHQPCRLNFRQAEPAQH